MLKPHYRPNPTPKPFPPPPTKHPIISSPSNKSYDSLLQYKRRFIERKPESSLNLWSHYSCQNYESSTDLLHRHALPPQRRRRNARVRCDRLHLRVVLLTSDCFLRLGLMKVSCTVLGKVGNRLLAYLGMALHLPRLMNLWGKLETVAKLHLSGLQLFECLAVFVQILVIHRLQILIFQTQRLRLCRKQDQSSQ